MVFEVLGPQIGYICLLFVASYSWFDPKIGYLNSIICSAYMPN